MKDNKLFWGVITDKNTFIIHADYFDAKNIFSHPFLYNIKHRTNVVQYLSKKMNKSL